MGEGEREGEWECVRERVGGGRESLYGMGERESEIIGWESMRESRRWERERARDGREREIGRE